MLLAQADKLLIAQMVKRLNQLMIAFGKIGYVHGADATELGFDQPLIYLSRRFWARKFTKPRSFFLFHELKRDLVSTW